MYNVYCIYLIIRYIRIIQINLNVFSFNIQTIAFSSEEFIINIESVNDTHITEERKT